MLCIELCAAVHARHVGQDVAKLLLPLSAALWALDDDWCGRQLALVLGLSGAGFSSVAARGIYEGLAGVNLAASVSLDGGAYKGATVGGTYEVDDSTTLKVVSTDALSLKAGLSKELAAGVTLTVGHAVDAAKIADTSAHTVGWTLEIK